MSTIGNRSGNDNANAMARISALHGKIGHNLITSRSNKNTVQASWNSRMGLISGIEHMLSKKIDSITELAEKTLHTVSVHSRDFGNKYGRPYYYLGRGWGMTSLDTGNTFFVNTDDRNITPWIIMSGLWEPDVTRVLLEYTRQGMAIIDIGAHCGYYSVKLGDKIGKDGRIFVFEPNPDMAKVCIANLNINGLRERTHFYGAALSDHNGIAILNRSEEYIGSSNILGNLIPDSIVEVETLTLDSLTEIDQPIDIMKIDAEGSEVLLLKGADKLLKRSPDCAIMMEWGEKFWQRHAPMSEILDICGGQGKRLHLIQPDGTLKQISVEKAIMAVKAAEPAMPHFLIVKPHLVATYIPHLISL